MTYRNRILHFVYSFIILLLVLAIVFLSIIIYKNKNCEEPEVYSQYYLSKVNSFEVQNSNLSKNQIVFLGDSITDLFLLDDYFYDIELATYNRGIIGDKTAGVLNRLKTSVLDLEPSKVVIMIGINDINSNIDLLEIYQNYVNILTEIKTKLPSVKIYCMSILPVNSIAINYFPEINVAYATESVLFLNSQIKNFINTQEDMTYIDLFSLLADENNLLKEEYTYDGLHYNTSGYDLWASLIKPYLI